MAGGLPGGTADLASLKPGFPAQVLIPPQALDPFASLQLSSVQSQLQTVSVSTLEVLHTYPQSYAVEFVDPNPIGQFHVAGAGVAGAISRQLYDDTAADLLKTFSTCAPVATYCGRPTNLPACPPIPCVTQAEIFRGLTVKGSNALVVHEWSEVHNVDWMVTWFDSHAGVTYSLSTANGANPNAFDNGVSATNQAGAQLLTAMAEQLVPWTGT